MEHIELHRYNSSEFIHSMKNVDKDSNGRKKQNKKKNKKYNKEKNMKNHHRDNQDNKGGKIDVIVG